MARVITCTSAGLQQGSTGVSSHLAHQHQAGDSQLQHHSADAKGMLPQIPVPFSGMPAFMMPPFGLMPFPMHPMLPGIMPPVGNAKGMPPMPMMFPHPAQLQAMSQAAQAAMAHAAKQLGNMPPFPVGMIAPMPMMMHPAAPCLQSTTPHSHQGNWAAVAGTAPEQLTGEAAAVSAAYDDDDAAYVNEDVEVEPELEQIFEKVAAMEREKAQQHRTSSPCNSIHSAVTDQQSMSHPCRPAAGTSIGQPAVVSVAATGSGSEAAPVPWLSFAEDDKVDNLDDDLAQIITLPDLARSSSGSPTGCLSPVAKVAGKPYTRIQRVSSTGSAYSSGDALSGAAAAALTADINPAAASKASKLKVLRIRSIKGCGRTAGTAVKAVGASNTGSTAPAAPASKASSNSSRPVKPTAAVPGLGAVKAGVQKKVCTGSNSSSKVKGVKVSVEPTAAAVQEKIASPAVQQPAATADMDMLGDLAELDSTFSDTCFASSADDMGIDSFDFMGELLQESSGDAWDGLLGIPAAGMELCSDLGSN